MVALIARYHRKAIPSPEHDDYAALAPADQRRVRVRAACLRVADAFDRRHVQRVDPVAVRLAAGVLEVVAFSTTELAAELAAAEKKADLLRQEFEGEVRFSAG